MLYIENTSLDPFYNQAFEEFVFDNFDGDIFLLWQNSPAVIVGSYQNICKEVNIESLRKLNIPVVRRMSGGGTVYHDLGNVNYTYITKQEGPVDYDNCLNPILTALNAIGVPAEKNRTCDIAIKSLKISGSAQRLVKGKLMHHGTLLFESNLDAINEITHNKNEYVESKGTVSAICNVTNIKDHITKPMTLSEFKIKLLDNLIPDADNRIHLTPEQNTEVCRLRDERYHSWEWTWGKTPAFSYEKTGKFLNNPIHVSYKTKKGILSDVKIECDAFDSAKALKLLSNSKLDPDEFLSICSTLVGEKANELITWLL